MKKNNIFKVLGFIVGACAALAAVGAIKKKLDEEKQREAEIEAEITEIIEKKLAEQEDEGQEDDAKAGEA